jgi:hypothetical protein
MSAPPPVPPPVLAPVPPPIQAVGLGAFERVVLDWVSVGRQFPVFEIYHGQPLSTALGYEGIPEWFERWTRREVSVTLLFVCFPVLTRSSVLGI